jgi:4-amino-4-deoxy-L-arabinose transferase-like glycosyltransferase
LQLDLICRSPCLHALLFLAWTRQFVRLRRFVLRNSLALTAGVATALFTPTKGFAVVAPLPADVVAALPPGAAVYHGRRASGF